MSTVLLFSEGLGKNLHKPRWVGSLKLDGATLSQQAASSPFCQNRLGLILLAQHLSPGDVPAFKLGRHRRLLGGASVRDPLMVTKAQWAN